MKTEIIQSRAKRTENGVEFRRARS